MSAGLQVFDGQGNLTVSITDRLSRFGAIVTITPGVSGSYTINGEGTPFFAALDEDFTFTGNVCPALSISGMTVSWSGGRGRAVQVMMGVY